MSDVDNGWSNGSEYVRHDWPRPGMGKAVEEQVMAEEVLAEGEAPVVVEVFAPRAEEGEVDSVGGRAQFNLTVAVHVQPTRSKLDRIRKGKAVVWEEAHGPKVFDRTMRPNNNSEGDSCDPLEILGLNQAFNGPTESDDADSHAGLAAGQGRREELFSSGLYERAVPVDAVVGSVRAVAAVVGDDGGNDAEARERVQEEAPVVARVMLVMGRVG